MFANFFGMAKRLKSGAHPTRLKMDTTQAFTAWVAISPSDISLLLEQIASALLWAQNEIPDGNGFNLEGRMEVFVARVNDVAVSFQLARVCLSSSGDVTDILARAVNYDDTARQVCQTLGLRYRAGDSVAFHAHFTYLEHVGIAPTQVISLKRFTLPSEDVDLDCIQALYVLWAD